MGITMKIDENKAEIFIDDKIDASSIKMIAAKADKAVASGVQIVNINVAEATDIDSAGITGLLHLRIGLLDRGMDMRLINARPELLATLRLLRVGGMLNLE